MTSVRPKDRVRENWFDVFFVRLREGFGDHLRYFSTEPRALSVWLWALLARDHETGEFVADRRAIMLETGLSDRQVKKAVSWLRHGRRCPCLNCAGFNAFDWTLRPSYFEEIRPAFRGSPPILRIRRDDSEFLSALARAKKAAKSSQIELDLLPVPALDSGITWGQFGENSKRGPVGVLHDDPFPA